MLARGSLKFVLPPLLVGLVLIVINYYLIASAFILLGSYMAWFFRDPNRPVLPDSSLLYAAADGKIKEILPDGNQLKIAIRMSPFDVHLNRAPFDADVSNIEYKPGKHSNVYFGGAEDKNEQNLISLSGDELEVDVLQITGAFARRLECWVKLDESVRQGQKIGIIRFGSQTNMLITPKNAEKVEVIPICELGQQVYAGTTAVAEIRRLQDE